MPKTPRDTETDKEGGGCPAAPWNPPETAPRDGTVFLADIGWPWTVSAVWDGHGKQWCYAAPQACPMDDGTTNSYFENDTEWESGLNGWMPLPELPKRKAND